MTDGMPLQLGSFTNTLISNVKNHKSLIWAVSIIAQHLTCHVHSVFWLCKLFFGALEVGKADFLYYLRSFLYFS